MTKDGEENNEENSTKEEIPDGDEFNFSLPMKKKKKKKKVKINSSISSSNYKDLYSIILLRLMPNDCICKNKKCCHERLKKIDESF